MSRKRKDRPKPDSERPHAEIRKRTVENPYFQTDHKEGATNPKYSNADINVKESAVETLYARRFLGFSQKRAADKIRELFEAAGGKASSIDYTLDRVDGGKGEPITGRLLAAHELARLRSLIGHRGYETLVKVCCEGKALTEITPHKRERLTMADNVRADLDDAAAMWGFQTKTNRR
jgi:hypothetical protein